MRWIALTFVLFFVAMISLPHPGWSQKMPPFWISNLKGETFHSRKQQTPYVISFFFTSCEPCIQEIPRLHQWMSKEFPHLPILFIDPLGEDSKEAIQEFAETLKVPLEFFYHDPLGNIGKPLFKGKREFPTIVGIKEGEVLFRYGKFDDPIMKEMRRHLSQTP